MFFGLIISSIHSDAQNFTTKAKDTVKLIEILSANSLRQITLNHSSVLETLAGNAVVRQGSTTLSGDSIVLDKNLGIAEVFGHVHISDADTVHTYSDYLRYLGNEQIAYLNEHVTLTDSKATLQTNSLVYNIKTGVSTYENGGTITNGNTTLNSSSGTYYSNTKDAYFIGNVKLDDPKYKMRSDSLMYNTAKKTVFFVSPTHIISENGVVDTRSGNYNIENGEAYFADRTVFKDGPIMLSGNKLSMDDKKGKIIIEDNGVFTDTDNKVKVLGNLLVINKKNNSFIATKKPVLILYDHEDSTFITADTLYSERRLMDSSERNIKHQYDSSYVKNKNSKITTTNDSISIFKGYRHVKIFNDSIQAVCDSMYFSSLDSSFRLMQHPLCWNGNTQLKGDTINVLTKNKKPRQVHIINKAMAVNITKEGLFNQVSGMFIKGTFIEGRLQHISDRGAPAESIYYPQDDDSAYVGMNRSKGEMIELFFKEDNISKIKYTQNVEGTLYPMIQIPENLKRLDQFIWLPDQRPKNKLEIFE